MKILVISDLPHFVTGGAEMQAARLVKAWTDAGHQVVCLGRRMAAPIVEIGGRQIETRLIWTAQKLGRPGRALTYFLSLSRLLWEYRNWADIIYCRFLGDAAVTTAVCKQLGMLSTPLIPTPANAGPDGDLSYVRSVPGSRFLIRLMDRHSNAVNLIAPRMEQDLREAGFQRVRISKIPNGIEIANITRSAGVGKLKVVSVGRLASQKGYDLLIDALASAPVLAESMEISILGAGPDAEILRGRAARLPPGLLKFEGELDSMAVRRRLIESDLFLLPSRYEGMSNAALEAMECGLPLLITACGGIDQYVDSTIGWVVPVGDPVALSRSLSEVALLGRDTLTAMGANSRRRVEELFSMDRVSDLYIKLFKEILSEDHGSRT